MRCLPGLFLSLLVMVAGCEPDDGPCEAASTRRCESMGCQGAQVCSPDGSGYGACVCDGTDASAPDAGSSDGGRPDAGRSDGGPPDDRLLAFPSARGAGSEVTGGRGGVVVPVTRLDDALDADDDPVEGTLRFALTRRFPRTVVFRVSGTIVVGDTDGDGVQDSTATFPGMIALEDPEFSDLTVAGQTAPLGGITIAGHIYTSQVSNMIWRYVRIRKDQADNEFDTVTINNTHDVVLDHLSVSYGTDETVSLSSSSGATQPQTGITLQYNLIAASKTGSIIGATGGREVAGECSLHNNFYTQITHRFPNLAGDGDYEVVNNLVYNWAFRLVNVHNAPRLNHMNNAYVAGPRTMQNATFERVANKVHMSTEGVLSARIYSAGNFITDLLTDPSADNWPTWSVFVGGNGTSENDPVPAALQATSAFPMLGMAPVTVRTASEVMASLPDEVGAFRTLSATGEVHVFRDTLDDGYLTDYQTASGPNYSFDRSGFTYPAVPSNAPYPDGDADGMPDAWETAQGFDPETDDSAADDDGDGYTNLEEFLNLVDA